MGNNEISGANRILFNNSAGLINPSEGVIIASGHTLRGKNYNAPINNNDFTQKKYVDDKIAAAVIEATQGGLTETVADTLYLKLDGTNKPTGAYEWNNVFTSTGGVYLSTEKNSYVNNEQLMLRKEGTNQSVGLVVNLRKGTNTPVLGVASDNYPAPLFGTYTTNDNTEHDGYFITDKYLFSTPYLSSAPFVRRSGDKMEGSLNMGGYTIVGVGSLEFSNETETAIIYMRFTNYGLKLGHLSGNPVEILNIAEPTQDNSAVNLAYLKEYCEGKTLEVTLTGVVDTILAHNTEYTIKDFTALTLVCDNAKTAENHGYIKFPNVPIVPTLTGFSGIEGDDITQAAANEVWEFSCFKGYMLFKNWGVAA